MAVLQNLKNRRMEFSSSARMGLKGFPAAIEAVFPSTLVQTCIAHLIRAASYQTHRRYSRSKLIKIDTRLHCCSRI
jgi:transposase-like protein